MTATVVRVLPDVPAIDRSFDYLLPASFGEQVRVGTMVRIPLAGRRVAGWVLELDPERDPGISLSEVSKVVGEGPDPEVLELARWAAWRWAGRLATMLRLGSPERTVAARPLVRERPGPPVAPDTPGVTALGLGAGAHVVEVAPTTDPLQVASAAAALGQVLVVVPSVAGADRLVGGLRRGGAAVARWPRDWSAAAAGATVVGGRSAVFAPAPRLRAVVVVDEHDETLQNESSPTWHARELAVERARRAGVPCLLVSPCPTLEALAAQSPERTRSLWARPGPDAPATPTLAGLPEPTERVSVTQRRSGWAPLDVIDRRGEDSGRTGLYSSRLVTSVREVARGGGRVVCVLNRTGRARLLACRSCGTLAECERCGSSVHQDDRRLLLCMRCGTERPGVCLECGSSAMSLLRLGVGRAGEELEALVQEPVATVTAAGGDSDVPRGVRVLVGTEAVLHRVASADLVAFLDMDQELFAPRYRAAEEALSLLVMANRVLGGRSRGGRLVAQTRAPEHEVLQAALRADPRLVSEVEGARRRLLRFPPAATLAVLGGEAAEEYVARVGTPLGIDVLGPDEGRWMLRSDDPERLWDHLSGVERPAGRLRLQVDPARIR